MPRPKGSRNVAGKVRATFHRLTEGDNPKFDFEKALLESLQTNFVDTMRMLKGYEPPGAALLALHEQEMGEEESGQAGAVFQITLVRPEPIEEEDVIEGEVIDITQPPKIELKTVPSGD